MNQVELLRHVADNIENGREVSHGLLVNGMLSNATKLIHLALDAPQAYSLIQPPKTESGVVNVPDELMVSS